MKNGEQPAFPVLETDTTRVVYEGLNKREYFAGLAMQALAPLYRRWDEDQKVCAKRAINMADELLKQLESNPL